MGALIEDFPLPCYKSYWKKPLFPLDVEKETQSSDGVQQHVVILRQSAAQECVSREIKCIWILGDIMERQTKPTIKLSLTLHLPQHFSFSPFLKTVPASSCYSFLHFAIEDLLAHTVNTLILLSNQLSTEDIHIQNFTWPLLGMITILILQGQKVRQKS